MYPRRKCQLQPLRKVSTPTRFVRAPLSDKSTLSSLDKDHDRDNFDEVAQIARSAYKLTKEIMGELNTEQKVIFGSIIGNRPSFQVFITTPLNQSSQGITDAARTGDSIKVTNFFMRGCVFNLNASTASNYFYPVRIIAYWQDGIDAITQSFPSTASSSNGLLQSEYSSTVLAPYSPKDYDLDAATTILYDETFIVDSQHPMHEFKKLIKVHRKTQYEQDSSVVATGSLRWFCISNVTAADANRPQVDFLYRVYFVDN